MVELPIASPPNPKKENSQLLERSPEMILQQVKLEKENQNNPVDLNKSLGEKPRRTLPEPNDYVDFAEAMVRAGNLAKLSFVKQVETIELHENGFSSIYWDGKWDDVIYIGYPFIVMDKKVILNEETMTPEKTYTPRLPGIGIPLHVLFWSPEHKCFACLRSDVYFEEGSES